MPRPEYQETIAAYLSGRRRVGNAELAAAVTEANRDPAYREQLARFIGSTPDWQSDCHSLRARLAELAEYSSTELLRLFPSFNTHLESCADCRQAYWSVKPRWTSVAADAVRETAARIRQRLAAGLQLMVTASRTLIEAGIAPMSEPVATVAATADAAAPSSLEGADQGGQREWRFEDETCGAVVCLTISARPGEEDGALLGCALQLPGGPVREARLQLVDRATGRVIVSGPLSRFTEHPMELEPGSYLLAIECGPPLLAAWEIPIDLTAGSERAT